MYPRGQNITLHEGGLTSEHISVSRPMQLMFENVNYSSSQKCYMATRLINDLIGWVRILNVGLPHQ